MRLSSVATNLAFLVLGSVHLTLAQSSSASSSASATLSDSPTSTSIPSGTTSGCSAFLTTLNNDPTFKPCLNGILEPLKSSSITSASNATQLDATLNKLCVANVGCDSSQVRIWVDQFWKSCREDLQSKNAAVLQTYDYLYMLNPLRDSICSKDGDGNFCLKTMAKAAATAQLNATTPVPKRSLVDHLEPESSYEQLSKRQSAPTTKAVNPAFIFLTPQSPHDVLCSQCARNVLAAYIKFETSIPYGIGLRNSDKLAVQSDIFQAGQQQCGTSYAHSINVIANTTVFEQLGAATPTRSASTFGWSLVAGLAALALVF